MTLMPQLALALRPGQDSKSLENRAAFTTFLTPVPLPQVQPPGALQVSPPPPSGAAAEPAAGERAGPTRTRTRRRATGSAATQTPF